MSKPTTQHLFLRSYLGDVPGQGQPKSVAFSPDIIPSFGNVVSASTLIATYPTFEALPIVPFDVNNVYIRGLAVDSSNDSSAFTMFAIPSEMILWPQVWNKASPLGPGPIVIPGAAKGNHVGAEAPFTARLSDLGGVNYALIAVQSPVILDSSPSKRLNESVALPPSMGNWRDYFSWISADKSTTFYNTIVADPTSPVISITTRLRLFEDDSSIDSIDVMLLFEHASIDPKTEVSIVSDVGSIVLGRTMLGADTGTIGIHTSLPKNYDGLVTFNIFPTSTPIPDMAWIALQVSALKNEGTISEMCILGAQNVVFAADQTRNARFVSPAAVAASANSKTVNKQGNSTKLALGDPAPVEGWWFRDNLLDTNNFPRTGTASHSPDIQPMGTVPDSNVVADLSGANAAVDVSDGKSIQLVGGAPNFVNLRGNCTLGSYAVDTRLFYVPCNVMISPSQYGQHSVNDYNSHGDPTGPAFRSITTGNANTLNVVGNPFNILNPVDPKTIGSDHYCLVGETRHPTTYVPDPQWPHEQTGDFITGADLNAWVCGNPNVCWRNIGYTTVGGGADKLYPTTMSIPADKYSPSTLWLLTVNGTNVPINSAWALTASGNPIPGININFLKTTITSNSMTQGVHFTGLPSAGYTASLTLQWWSNGQPPVVGDGKGMRFSYTLITVAPSLMAPANRFSSPLPAGSNKWPLYVGIHHPGLKQHANKKGLHALVPPYEKHGLQIHSCHAHKRKHLTDTEIAGFVGVDPSNGTSLGGDTFVTLAN